MGTFCTESVKPRSSLTLWIHHSFAPLQFDHLVGAQQECFWNFHAKCLSGGHIDDEIELGRLHSNYSQLFVPATIKAVMP